LKIINPTPATMLGGIPVSGLAWDFKRLGFAHRCVALVSFASAMAVLVLLGYGLRGNFESFSMIWPAAGLLFVALWLSPGRNWGWIVAIQVVVQLGLFYAYADDRAHWQWGPVFTAANSLAGIVGTVAARRLVPAPSTDIGRILLFFAAIAFGEAVGAIVGAYASIHTDAGTHFPSQWQLWWVGGVLGSLFVAPAILSWTFRLLLPHRTARPPAAADLVLAGGALLGATYWIFSSPSPTMSSLFESPVAVVAAAIVVAFRLPPRWAATFTALSVLIAAYFTSRHLGPFSLEPDPFARTVRAQVSLAAFIVIEYILVFVIFEMRNTLRLLRQSDDRYRHFIEKTSEAVWHIELAIPMALDLDLDAQIAWLRKHGYIDECNLAYRQLRRHIAPADAETRVWQADAPWSVIYLQHLEEAVRRGYSIDGLQFSLPTDAGRQTYLTGFTGVIEDNKLASIWGVARNITELVQLNEALNQRQSRVAMYAQRLINAEEHARRATAIDLHDGIGQQLVGLALSLDAAGARSPLDVRLVLREASHTLREIHAITRRVIADLSPPGLYELGLGAALQWLRDYMRSRDDLEVDLRVEVDDSALDLDLRIVAFKLIRELLRNVVKHSGVKSARVMVAMTSGQLSINVVDTGVGFTWELSLFETRAEGLGLWSVVERVREAGGEMRIETAPGRGCSVSLTLPVDRQGRSWCPVLDIQNQRVVPDDIGGSAADPDASADPPVNYNEGRRIAPSSRRNP
jgi:signal transduction histidine kinase